MLHMHRFQQMSNKTKNQRKIRAYHKQKGHRNLIIISLVIHIPLSLEKLINQI